MAIRKKLTHDASTRDRIKTSQLVNRLEDHALGKIELTRDQITAISILLKKTLPDLQAIEHSGNVGVTIGQVAYPGLDG